MMETTDGDISDEDRKRIADKLDRIMSMVDEKVGADPRPPQGEPMSKKTHAPKTAPETTTKRPAHAGMVPRTVAHYDPFTMHAPDDKAEAAFWARRHPAMQRARQNLLRAQGEADLVYDVLLEVHKEKLDVLPAKFPDEGEYLDSPDAQEIAETDRHRHLEETRTHVKEAVLAFGVPLLRQAEPGPQPFLLSVEEVDDVLKKMETDAFGCVDPSAFIKALKRAEKLHDEGSRTPAAHHEGPEEVFPDEGRMPPDGME